MGLSDNQGEVSPEAVRELGSKLATMRHNINNNLALLVAALELLKRKPDMAPRLLESMSQQPDKIVEEMRQFSDAFESALGFSTKTGAPRH